MAHALPAAERNGVKLLIHRSAGKPRCGLTGSGGLQRTPDALEVEYHDAGARVRAQIASDLLDRCHDFLCPRPGHERHDRRKTCPLGQLAEDAVSDQKNAQPDWESPDRRSMTSCRYWVLLA